MEEIWKDIPNLPSLKNPNNSFDGMNLQEFLARPFMYPNYNLSPVFQAITAAPTTLFPAGHAANNVVLLRPQGNSLSSYPAVSHMTCSSQKQQHLGLSMQSSSGGAGKGIVIPYEIDDRNDSSYRMNRHHQRLIKNRESAARSRNRKEAYTAQLEGELETLKAENAMLKKKDHQLQEADQALKKHALNRSSSFPF